MIKYRKAFWRVLSLCLCMTLMFSLATPAFATGDGEPPNSRSSTIIESDPVTVTVPVRPVGDITVKGGHATSYMAVRLLDMTASLKVPGCHDSMEDHITEGDDSCFNYSYQVPEEFRELLLLGLDCVSEDEIDVDMDDIEIVAAISSLSAAQLRTFADVVSQNLPVNMDRDGTRTFTVDMPDVNGDYTFEDLPQGWYVILATEASDLNGAYTLAILNTVGLKNVEVTAKSGVPTITKKILVPNSAAADGYDRVDTLDVAWGDTVQYELVITWPDNIANSPDYQYQVLNIDEGMEIISVDLVQTDGKDDSDGLQDRLNGIDSKSMYAPAPVIGFEHDCPTYAEGGPGENHFAFANCAHGWDGVTKDSRTVIRYSAKLAEDYTTASTGNKGAVILVYTADPYVNFTQERPLIVDPDREQGMVGDVWTVIANILKGEADTDGYAYATPDYTSIFTYTATATKQNAGGEDLAGANFVLYRWTGDNYDEAKASDNFEELVDMKRDIDHAWVPYRTDNLHDVDESAFTDHADGSLFTFKALDSGIYRLVETVVPDGYYKADDLIFEVVGTYDESFENLGTAPQVRNIDIKVDGTSVTGEDGMFSVNVPAGTMGTIVVNNSGLRLPAAGGTGTVYIYVMGAIVVALAVCGMMLSNAKKKEQQ